MPKLIRLAPGKILQTHKLAPPFSNFKFVEAAYGPGGPIAHLFSQARLLEAQVLQVEEIAFAGTNLEEENEDIRILHPAYQMSGLERLSFWSEHPGNKSSVLLGYAILKRDVVQGHHDAWHVFEALFALPIERNRFIPCIKSYDLTVESSRYSLKGVLYCQQNGLNKACAQVALRSLLSRLLVDGDITYRQINALASSVQPLSDPSDGLTSKQITGVLTQSGFGVQFVDYPDMEKTRPTLKPRQTYKFEKLIYSGIESGLGGLMSFKVNVGRPSLHIIPFFGHSFSPSLWSAKAEGPYQLGGPSTAYIPSSNWVTDFICHDDNFGLNLSFPTYYLNRDDVDCVFNILGIGVKYDGLKAEALGYRFLESIVNQVLVRNPSDWQGRLATGFLRNRAVLRALSLSKEEYLAHLSASEGWKLERESKQTIDIIGNGLPDTLWVVEVSLPELFPVNQRKIGEVVLNALEPHLDASSKIRNEVFLLARLAPHYFFIDDLAQANATGSLSFRSFESDIKTHTQIYLDPI